MRASRLLSIILLLQARKRLTAQALADEFEVSVRTIYRDMDQLSAAGIPVYADKGHHGGFRLLDGYQTKLTGLSEREAETLFLAGLPGPAAELGLSEAMSRARLKLLAALQSGSQIDAERVSRRFHLDPIAWFQRAESSEHLRALAVAMWGNNRVQMRYESWKGVVERGVAPLGLVLKAGIWYFVGKVGEQTRTYRVANILSLDAQGETADYPVDFDLASYWTAWSEDYEQRMQKYSATVRISPLGMRQLALQSHVFATAMGTAEPAGADGWCRVAIPIESIERATTDLLQLGGEVEALNPPALRSAIATAAQQVLAIYGDPASPG